MRSTWWVGLLVLTACGGGEPSHSSQSSSQSPAPEGCEAAADCHYDDVCMPSACQLEEPEAIVCEESMLPAGPCVCVDRRCEMQVPDPEPEPEPEPEPSCASDADCYFENPCAPSACTTEAPPDDLACAESWPARGECHCRAGRCAMQRFEPTRSDAECSAAAPCGFDLADGSCLPGQADESALVPEGGAQPVCRCLGARCVGGWVEPVACRSALDCWIGGGILGAVPIARPRTRPRRAFRPCEDGEVEPACVDGLCAVGLPYSC